MAEINITFGALFFLPIFGGIFGCVNAFSFSCVSYFYVEASVFVGELNALNISTMQSINTYV